MNETVPVYTGSNGKTTPIDKMADTHLVNAIRKIEKQHAEQVQGIEADERIGAPADVRPLYNAMLAELKRRPQQTQDWYVERRSKGI